MMKSFTKFLFILFLRCHSVFCNIEESAEPCTIVIFGAAGDLTGRKLIPAIYNLSFDEKFANNMAVVGFSRGKETHKSFREKMQKAINQFSRRKIESAVWENLEARIHYIQSDFTDDAGYSNLKEQLEQIDQQLGTRGNRLFYLSTQPKYFAPIIKKLKEHQLIYSSHDTQKFSRVLIEKPFGSDLDSALDLQNEISQCLDPSQVFLMDHYLGKEGVLNLLPLRFENTFFEPIWNNHYIDNVQITLSEEIGIGSRASFWEETGCLRDIVQNHLLQILSLIAMEKPDSFNSDDIHREKVNVLKALRPFSNDEISSRVIRGEYGPGFIKGQLVAGYHQEDGVLNQSTSETYLAAKLYIDNPRWMGTPFYIRAGKRLSKQVTEVVITFKPTHPSNTSNLLFIRIQPNPSVFWQFFSKVPSLSPQIQPVLCGFSSENYFKKGSAEAYEKLFYDSIRNDRSHFVDVEEHLAAWRLLTPVMHSWKTETQIYRYDAGSWGPAQADQLLQESGHQWHHLKE